MEEARSKRGAMTRGRETKVLLHTGTAKREEGRGKTIAEAQEGGKAKGSFSQGNWASQASQAEGEGRG